MMQEDYLMRQIGQLAQMLARVFRLRTNGEDAVAQTECARALRDVFGCEPDFLALLDPAHVLETLHLTSKTPPGTPLRELAAVVADLLDEYARLEQAAGRPAAAAPFLAHAQAIRARVELPGTGSPLP